MACSDAFSRGQEGREERDKHFRKYYGSTNNIKEDKKLHGQFADWRKEYFEGKRSYRDILRMFGTGGWAEKGGKSV